MLMKTIYYKKTKTGSIITSYILSILVAIFVYLLGGAPSAFANLMYIPIATVSSTKGKVHGIIHAFFSGLLLGPYMPMHTELGIYQTTVNWIIRLVIYIIIALIIGLFSEYNQKNKDYITNLLTHDSITDLKNIESIKRVDNFNGIPKTIIALSVREYEEILSFFGYDFTNTAIYEFSKRLRNILSKYDEIELYRYNGMEFILVAPSNDNNISEIIHKLSSINKSTIKVNDIPFYIEIVMGMTNIEGNESILEGVRQALVSLRYAIDFGGKLEIYTDDLEEYFKNIVNIASEFRHAMNEGHIKVAYQNIYCVKTGSIHGSELLTRWMSEEDLHYNPKDFIPIIEKTELINELSKLVIDNAINILLQDCNKNKVVSINLSPNNLKDEIIEYLIENIMVNKINPKQFQVEITEDVLVKKDEVISYLNKIRSFGMVIAIDDFGSGYSSYQYLSELPIDIIKIDKSLIMKINKNQISRSLIRSIVYFCKANNFKVVAEGVESIEIVDACRELDIDYIQGYYCHRPTIISKKTTF
ncbi:MAG: GGDEF domain-containing phosphodiesterase [Tissierellaceae bacterium]|nr:GGDEF domain-containing phosphodiesterase [Tissierellaceae bacterium]